MALLFASAKGYAQSTIEPAAPWSAATTVSTAQTLSAISAARPRNEAEKALLLRLKVEALSLLAMDSDETPVAQALALAKSVVQDAERAYGRSDIRMLPVLRAAARIQLRHNRTAEATALLNRAVEISKAAYGDDDPSHRFILYEIAAAYSRAGNASRAFAAKSRADYLSGIAEAATEGGITLGASPSEGTNATHQIVPVFFQTTRAPTGSSDPAERFGKVRDDKSHYGLSYVSVPKKREIGSIPHPSYFRLEFRADPKRHVIVLKEMKIYGTAAEFWMGMQGRVNASVRKEALVYIHGFNQSFRDGVETAATLGTDLEIDGVVVSFIWPSQNNPLLYSADGDEAQSGENRAALKGLLSELAGRTGAQNVHVVAHSMGNRLLLEALKAMVADTARAAVSSVTFASPDVQSSEFTSATNMLGHRWPRMTLYTAAGDLALNFSALLRGELPSSRTTRAGDRDGGVVATSFLDVVDTTSAKSDMLGHGNFARMAQDDFRALVWFGLPASKRCVLVDRKPSGWQYQPAAPCSTEAFSQASLYLRRYSDPQQALARLEASGDPKSRAAARLLPGLGR